MSTLIRFVFLCLILTFSSPVCAQTLTIYTEEFPPYNFTQKGRITGVSTEIVKQVLARAGFKSKIISLPWSQSYEIAQKKENALIYSISRRRNREKLFKWIGVLTPSTYSVFGLNDRSDVNVKTLEDLKRYKIGTTINDARESYLLGKGFTLSDFDRVGGDNAHFENLKKLIYAIKYFKRVDRIGFLAGDTPSSRKDGEWFRRGIREEIIERYPRTFDEWQESFTEMQSQVDVLILGNNSGIKDWNSTSAKEIALAQSSIPTGCVMDWMADYAFIGYTKGNLILNKKIANHLQVEFPDSFVKKAVHIIE